MKKGFRGGPASLQVLKGGPAGNTGREDRNSPLPNAAGKTKGRNDEEHHVEKTQGGTAREKKRWEEEC